MQQCMFHSHSFTGLLIYCHSQEWWDKKHKDHAKFQATVSFVFTQVCAESESHDLPKARFEKSCKAHDSVSFIQVLQKQTHCCVFFDFVFEISAAYQHIHTSHTAIHWSFHGMLLTAVADLPEDGEDFMKNRSKSAGAIMKQVDFMVMMGSLGANPPPSILVRGPLFVGCRKFKNDLSRPKITVDHYQEWQKNAMDWLCHSLHFRFFDSLSQWLEKRNKSIWCRYMKNTSFGLESLRNESAALKHDHNKMQWSFCKAHAKWKANHDRIMANRTQAQLLPVSDCNWLQIHASFFCRTTLTCWIDKKLREWEQRWGQGIAGFAQGCKVSPLTFLTHFCGQPFATAVLNDYILCSYPAGTCCLVRDDWPWNWNVRTTFTPLERQASVAGGVFLCLFGDVLVLS